MSAEQPIRENNNEGKDAAPAMPEITKTVLTAKNGSTITVHTLGDFHEVEIKAPQVAQGRHLNIIMRDTSGSMFDATRYDYNNSRWEYINDLNAPEHHATGTIGILNRSLQTVVDKAIQDNHGVVLISWARDSSLVHIDAKNQATALRDSCDAQASLNRMAEQARKPLSKDEFSHPEWWGATYPRVGFNRFMQVLRESKETPLGVTVWFGTDGSFIKPPQDEAKTCALDDTFVRELQDFLVQLNVPVKMVYVGITNDRTDDAKKIMEVFPVCDYMYARTRDDIPKLDILSGMQSAAVYDRAMSIQDGKRVLMIVEDYARVQCKTLEFADAKIAQQTQIDLSDMPYLAVRRVIHSILMMLNALNASRMAGGKIYDRLMKVNNDLKRLEQDIAKLRGGRSNDRAVTREYLFKAMRAKNMLQQYAAQEVVNDVKEGDGGRALLAQAQELKMVQGDKFSIAIAKRVTQNKANRRPWESTGTWDAKDGYVTKVTYLDTKQEVTYATKDVPDYIVKDADIDPLTCDSWAEVYTSGSCKTQCVLFTDPITEIVYHSPSRAKVRISLTQVSFDTVLDTIEQRVSVDGHASLFSRPFTGATSEDKYTVGLPTWSPNLNFVSRYRLRTMIGYLLGGHDLAYPGRWLDVYIPAIVDGWQQYFKTTSAAILQNTMMLQLAFVKIKEWTKLGNMADQKVITPAENMAFWMQNNEGTHAYMNFWEAMLYALMTPVDIDAVRSRAAAQIAYFAASRTDKLWDDYVKPMARDVIQQSGLLDRKDFDPKARFVDEKTGQIPVSKGVTEVTGKFRDRCKGAIETLDNFLRIQPVVAKAWAALEKDYRISDDLNTQIKTALKTELKDIPAQFWAGWMAIANDYPSNATRREMKHTGAEVFDQKCRMVFLEEAGEMRKQAYYANRYKESMETHAGFPIILTPADAAWLDRRHRLSKEQFTAEFCERFVAHIELEQTIMGCDEKKFQTALTTNLHKYWEAKGDGHIELSVTSLPKFRCGNILCPQFLRMNRQLDAHMTMFGSDLRNGHECRVWIPNMHVKMAGLNKKMGRDHFVNMMSQYALQYVDKRHLARFSKYFVWVYERS